MYNTTAMLTGSILFKCHRLLLGSDSLSNKEGFSFCALPQTRLRSTDTMSIHETRLYPPAGSMDYSHDDNTRDRRLLGLLYYSSISVIEALRYRYACVFR